MKKIISLVIAIMMFSSIAVYAVASDMYDKRAFQISTAQENEIVASILGARSVNLL